MYKALMGFKHNHQLLLYEKGNINFNDDWASGIFATK
jgi:hypothetical protein